MSALSDYYPDEESARIKILEDLWDYAKQVEPRAEEGLSYGLPALKLGGRPLIGFSIAKNHMSTYPFSPKVIEELKPMLSDYEYSKGVIRFTEDKVISREIIQSMISLRIAQLT